MRVVAAAAVLWSLCLSPVGRGFAQEGKPEFEPPTKLRTLGTDFKDWTVSARFSPDGQFLAVGNYDVVGVWNTNGWSQVATIKPRTGYAYSLAWLPKANRLAIGGYQKISLYDLKSWRRAGTLRGHRGYVRDLVVTPEGELLSASEDGTVRRWDPVAKSEVKTLFDAEMPVRGIALAPEGNSLAVAIGDENRVTMPGLVQLRDPMSGELLHEYPEHLKTTTDIAFSPSGKWLVSTSEDEKVNLYSVAEREAEGFYSGHARPTNSAILMSDERTVISVSGGRAKGKNEVRIWDRIEAREWVAFEAHKEKIVAAALSPDEKLLATVSHDGTALVWDVGSLMPKIHEALGIASNADTKAASEERQPLVAPRPTPEPEPQAMMNVQDEAARFKPIRVGIIGLDTSHVIAFTKAMNTPEVAPLGCRVTVAYPKGSPDIESSTSRVPKYTEQIQKYDVKIVDSIEALLAECDAVLLETNDGRPHLEQVIPVLKARKPVFVDKPFAGSLVDCYAIAMAAEWLRVPIFSSSSLRYVPKAQEVRASQTDPVLGATTYSPCSIEPTHPDLYWYGIHGVELLYTVMGPGCKTVTRSSTDTAEVVTGTWGDGRVGVFRGIKRGKKSYGGTVFTERGIIDLGRYAGYQGLVDEITQFFHQELAPIDMAETLEIYTFMSAADESKQQGGKPIPLVEVRAKAYDAAIEKLKTYDLEP